jgi:thiamine biosynthesis lipoprotein
MVLSTMSSRLLLFIASLSFQLFGQPLQRFEAVEPHMGTLFRIELYAADTQQAQAGFHDAFERIAQLDQTLSDYRPDSELNRLTRAAIGHPVQVSDDLLRVLSAAQKVSEKTDGAFDVTIGALTHLWREARKANYMPDSAALVAAKQRCGFSKMQVDLSEHTVKLDEAGMQLDAGGIAKGDAADQALLVLSAHGIKSALVAASGDLAFSDPPPGAAGWKIGLDSFDKANSAFTRVLVLANAAVSTSGPGEQHLDSGGKRYSHIINPVSGSGLTSELTVSVVTTRGIDADSFATAASVLGPERGLAFIENQPDTSAIVLTVENGRSRIVESSGFRKLPTAQ